MPDPYAERFREIETCMRNEAIRMEQEASTEPDPKRAEILRLFAADMHVDADFLRDTDTIPVEGGTLLLTDVAFAAVEAAANRAHTAIEDRLRALGIPTD
jgi:hypothetical protein